MNPTTRPLDEHLDLLRDAITHLTGNPDIANTIANAWHNDGQPAGLVVAWHQPQPDPRDDVVYRHLARPDTADTIRAYHQPAVATGVPPDRACDTLQRTGRALLIVDPDTAIPVQRSVNEQAAP